MLPFYMLFSLGLSALPPSSKTHQRRKCASDNIFPKRLRMNTSVSVDSTPLQLSQNEHLYKTQGEGCVMVNQKSHEGFLSRGAPRRGASRRLYVATSLRHRLIPSSERRLDHR